LSAPYNYYRRYHNSANAAEIRRIIATTRPDIIYVWELAGTGVTSLLNVLSELNVPTIFHLNSYWLLYASSPDTEQSRLRTRWFKQRLIGTIPAMTWASFIAISNTVKQKYGGAGFDPERIEVIYNGIDPRFLERPSAENSSRDGCQLLFVGRLRVEKGLLVLLKALAILINGQGESKGAGSCLRLDIFGTGDEVYIRELEAFVRAKHLNHIVTFRGKVPQDELMGRYDQAEMLLVPSLWHEPFGLVVAEAMARGLPVIASDIGGPAEIITHGVNGLLTAPGDEYALATAIRMLLEHPEQRKKLGQAARETVLERFTIEENAKRVEQHMRRFVREYNSMTHPSSIPLST
jgi:glycosyltransferase involved in cell wall biosynthesis